MSTSVKCLRFLQIEAFWVRLPHQRAIPLLAKAALVLGNNSFAGRFAGHLARRTGIRFEKPVHIVLKKSSFCIHTQRWLVERTLAWLSTNRRLSKEYDRLLTHANAWLTWANIRRILK